LSSSSLNECGYTLGSHKPLSRIETIGSSTHYGQASSHSWTPISPCPLPFTPILMAKPSSSTGSSCTSYVSTILRTPTPGMRVFPMFSTSTIEPYIYQPVTTPFRWGWDFNHWVTWMLHYPLRPPRQTCRMLQLELTNPPSSLRRSSTSGNRFKIFYRSPMLSTSSAMINMGCQTSFRWETKFGFTCKKNALQGLIGTFFHSFMDPIPSPRLWVTMLLSSTFPHSLAYTQYSMWTSFDLISHHYWTPRRSKNN
jgi:hypothetical protein